MVTVFPPAKHDNLSSPRMVSLGVLAWETGTAVNNQNLDEKSNKAEGKFSMCACAGAAEGLSDLCSREVNTRSAGAVSPWRHFFLSSIFVLSNRFIFYFVWMPCIKCQECRKTYYCVVVQGMRWCFCFVCCHKWSILDVQFGVETTWELQQQQSLFVRCRYFLGGVMVGVGDSATAVKICVGAEGSLPALVLFVYTGRSVSVRIIPPWKTLKLWLSV